MVVFVDNNYRTEYEKKNKIFQPFPPFPYILWVILFFLRPMKHFSHIIFGDYRFEEAKYRVDVLIVDNLESNKNAVKHKPTLMSSITQKLVVCFQ